MTTISRDDIIKLAVLGNLKLSDSEIDTLQTDLHAILGYVQQLDELDTTGVTPAYQVSGLTNVFRNDEVNAGTVSRETLLALAPSSQQNQIRVPKVL